MASLDVVDRLSRVPLQKYRFNYNWFGLKVQKRWNSFPKFLCGHKTLSPEPGVETPSRFGGSIINNVKFVDFGSCNNGKDQNYALVNNMARARYAYVYHDVANSVEISGLSF